MMNFKAELNKEKEHFTQLLNRENVLDISRGKPSKQQIDFVASVFKKAEYENDFYSNRIGKDNQDLANYGILNGISELRSLFGELLDIEPENIFLGGNSSLNLMYDIIVLNLMFGNSQSSKPWSQFEKIKFLCPSPGYDRHFRMSEYLGIESVYVPMTPTGPDMDIVEDLVQNDASIKGMWCVPLYSNPDGYIYSDETVQRLSSMKTAAEDFRIFWDNAYFIHYLDPNKVQNIENIIKLCKSAGNTDRVYQFSSTSKITFPGSGVALIASSKRNISTIENHFKYKTISYDKMNMLRHALVFENKQSVVSHMNTLAAINKPKFDIVCDALDKELADYDKYIRYYKPDGGYFISFYTMDGCAARTYELCKQAKLVLTKVGDAFPYGIDPNDNHIRIAPTFLENEDIANAIEIFCNCVKLAILEKLTDKR